MAPTQLLAGLILAAATGLAAQSASTSNPSSTPAATKTITLVGCVQPDAGGGESFTLSDTKTGTTYV